MNELILNLTMRFWFNNITLSHNYNVLKCLSGGRIKTTFINNRPDLYPKSFISSLCLKSHILSYTYESI